VRAELPLLETCVYLNSNATGATDEKIDQFMDALVQRVREAAA